MKRTPLFCVVALGLLAASLLWARDAAATGDNETLQTVITMAGQTQSAKTLANKKSSRPAKPAPPAKPKIQIVRHVLPRCVVSGKNISGEHAKIEVTYTVGNTEHHLFVADRFAERRFRNNPSLYFQKALQMEEALKTSPQ